MRIRAGIFAAGFGLLVAQSCALPHYGIDASLDESKAGSVGATDAGGTENQGGSEASLGGDGAAGTPMDVASLGDPCTEADARACVGDAQQERVLCDGQVWKATDSCVDDENCEQASGVCRPVLSECAGGPGGKRYCGEANALMECDVDLVNSEPVETCEGKCVTLGNTAECAPKTCGDKVTQAPETCDDGNDDDTDDCTTACKKATCGDTNIWAGHETCDDGNSVTESCPYGAAQCTVCNADCLGENGALQGCGDGTVQGGNEECDPAAGNAQSHCARSCELSDWALWPNAPIVPPASNYTSTADTVVDKTTQLMWERKNNPTDYHWVDAVAHCEELTLAGHSDWRLPSRVELLTLVDYSIPYPGPMINTTAFPDTPALFFWTSTGDSTYGVYVLFSQGYTGFFLKDAPLTVNRVRCVR